MERLRVKHARSRKQVHDSLASLCGLLLGLCASNLLAAPAEILVVDNGGAVHTRIRDAARAELRARGSDVRLLEVRGDGLHETLATAGNPTLVVTLGSNAARELQGELPVPVLHAAIAASLYPELLASEEPGTHPHGHSALFLDQPATRQIIAVQLALPHLQRLGVLASAGREASLDPLLTAGQGSGIEMIDAVVPNEGLLIPRVEQLMRHSDALLITPDPELYNSHTLQKVLLAAYRQRKPVIGLSSAYVKAGALLAVHADPEAIGRDLADLLASFVASGELEPPSFARRYAIAINRRVARSLGLNLPDEQVLLRALQQREANP